MNEQTDKLCELAEQAGLHREWFIDNPEIERFAELIINECISIINRTSIDEENDWMGNDPPALSYVMRIQNHFGI